MNKQLNSAQEESDGEKTILRMKSEQLERDLAESQSQIQTYAKKEEEAKRVKYIIEEEEKVKLRETIKILQNEIEMLKQREKDISAENDQKFKDAQA